MKTEKHCKIHAQSARPYCVECYRDDLANEKADDRLARTACSRRLLAALLKPTIEMMREAGISRMACGADKSFVLQMEDGKVITIDQPT